MSLRTLINIRIVLSVLVILLLGGVTAVWQARQSVAEEVQSSINLALQIVKAGVVQVPLSNRYGSQWLLLLNTLQQTRHLQISIAEDGNEPVELTSDRAVIGSSSTPPNWFINAVQADYLTEKYDIFMIDGSVNTIFISADPMDEITEAWEESQIFFWSITVMLAVIFLAVNLVFNSALGSMKTILSGLQQLEDGNYDLTLPQFKISEFDTFALQINEMSAALKTARQNNRALTRHTMQIQELERKNISRELHDEMGQSLTAIKAMVVAAKQPNVGLISIADPIIEVCNHLVTVVRSMIRTLHPLSLTELGLEAALTDLVNEWDRRATDLNINMDYDNALEKLSSDVAIHAYRIVQECLTNVVRHAQASRVVILVKKRSDNVLITVTDNGVGGRSDKHGFGVLGMRERAESLGGTFLFGSVTGQGVKVIAQLPYSQEQ